MSKPPTRWTDITNAPAPGTFICAMDTLTDGGVALLSVGSTEPPFRLLLMRSGNSVRAYVNRCAHFGVPLAAKPAHLIFTPYKSVTCNVHYARYSWQDGRCEFGDCDGESLMAVPVVVQDRQVLIGEVTDGTG